MLQGLGPFLHGLVLSQALHTLVPADVMQNFSSRPEVQLRAVNKFLTMPEDQLGKGPAPFADSREGWAVGTTKLLPQAFLACMVSTGQQSGIREATARRLRASQPDLQGDKALGFCFVKKKKKLFGGPWWSQGWTPGPCAVVVNCAVSPAPVCL